MIRCSQCIHSFPKSRWFCNSYIGSRYTEVDPRPGRGLARATPRLYCLGSATGMPQTVVSTAHKNNDLRWASGDFFLASARRLHPQFDSLKCGEELEQCEQNSIDLLEGGEAQVPSRTMSSDLGEIFSAIRRRLPGTEHRLNSKCQFRY